MFKRFKKKQPLLQEEQGEPPQMMQASQTPVTSFDGLSVYGGLTPDGARTPFADSELSWINQTEAYEIMAAHLHKLALRKNWFSENPQVASGVALRLAKGKYVMCPANDSRLDPFCRSVSILNVEVAMTITSPVVSAITSRLVPGTSQVPLTPSQHVQVVETMAELAGARKAQNACFVRTERVVVIWCDQVESLEPNTQDLNEKMINFVWQSATTAAALNTPTSLAGRNDSTFTEFNLMQRSHTMLALANASHMSVDELGHSPFSDANRASSSSNDPVNPSDLEKGQATATSDEYQERPTNLQAPFQHGLAVALDIVCCFLFLRGLFKESLIDGNWKRMLIGLATLPMFPVILFFCDNIIGDIAQIFGPINQLHRNSRYYSGKPPKRITSQLPHITIQLPVYKESLETVLMPTIESVKVAISTYELQGGTASIIVSEDGMQLISENEQMLRQEYYDKNNIGWVARPGHGTDGYLRKGRFKKASNLNFTCQLSLMVEKSMAERRNNGNGNEAAATWTEAEETALYHTCLEQALPQLHPLVQAQGNIRIGDLILLIDSDTRVPSDCLLDAASEMTQCPDVGVLQHCSGVMLVSDSYFERGIGFFTRLVNFSISYIVASGDVAPFMGHNAFLRWSAVQEASMIDPEDGVQKVWSESHVSEDFDMALRLLMKGYITRWATYSNNGFQEGVSLTCDDELNRWQKYAFGCSELVFNPIHQWLHKSPFTPLFRKFLFAKGVPIYYKFSACSYIFSYYVIASSLPITFRLYFVEGWMYPVIDPIFLTPFNIFLAVVVIFIAGGNVAQAVSRYRGKVGGILPLLWEHLIWLPFMVIFFGEMPFHVLTALLSHLSSINMTWGATVKDLEDSNFFIEVPAILKRFWKIFIFCFMSLAMIVVLSIKVVSLEWQIPSFFTFFPLLLSSVFHILYLIALNPALLRFSF